MPTNKLPVLGGGERELRDGDRVRLRCGWEVTIESNWKDKRTTGNNCWWPGESLSGVGGSFNWCHAGRCVAKTPGDQNGFDIVLILGPESVDNGDGTVTKLCTLPVTMPAETWSDGEPVAFHKPRPGETFFGEDGDVLTCSSSDWLSKIYGLILSPRPKPQPSPFIRELVRRLCLEKGDPEEVVLPPTATKLEWADGLWRVHTIHKYRMLAWEFLYNGPLPSLKDFPHDGHTVDLAVVREMVKEAKENG